MSPLTGLVTAFALLVYFVLTINVGRARAKYGVPVPKVTGNRDFERVFRVQQNMLEQLVLFLPTLWLCSIFFNPLWSSGLGLIWVLGRILYAWGYYQAAEKRGPGFAISSLSVMALIAIALVKLSLLTLAEFR